MATTLPNRDRGNYHVQKVASRMFFVEHFYPVKSNLVDGSQKHEKSRCTKIQYLSCSDHSFAY
ncbi:hypothetical protein Lpp71_01979 [Lacticaseibacillus paracasei subsp. paracasei Lpp71]|uniref:Uncharacterized protein n=1 Tax=Lacticaseibacillus paracasei subsp. paracasei Lpp71 TaxID=1256207 RepID=A0A8E0IU35_LACPA|nr:hypothetical protein Lpp71_01979 [Lacticaseibacillus paracasei subsp. paracasei Lpp71]